MKDPCTKVNGWYDDRFVGEIDVIDIGQFHLLLLLVTELVQKVIDLKTVITDMFYPFVLLKVFQWHSRCPREMCAVVCHEWHIGYVFKTGWKSTNSPFSLVDEVVMRVLMYKML